jgi:putative intracellular protease/amidase
MYNVSFRKVDIDRLTIAFRDAGSTSRKTMAMGCQADRKALSLIEDALSAGKPVALVCYAPGILASVKVPHGAPIAVGRAVTGGHQLRRSPHERCRRRTGPARGCTERAQWPRHVEKVV